MDEERDRERYIEREIYKRENYKLGRCLRKEKFNRRDDVCFGF